MPASFGLDVTHLGGAIDLDTAKIALSSDDGDSFVAKLIAEGAAGAGSRWPIAYRDDRVEVHGGPARPENGIELTFPLNLNIFDVILLRELYLAARPSATAPTSSPRSRATPSSGRIAVTVDRVGLPRAISARRVLSVQAAGRFGLSLDASDVRGSAASCWSTRRAAATSARSRSPCCRSSALTAIGIITTKNPDGTPGLLAAAADHRARCRCRSRSATGSSSRGAGGLLGLNRGMDVDRIRDGLRTGTADSILFPTDIIRRIDVIVRDLEESFPAAEGHFLIAPMAMITWMNPALVTLKIGIILEIAPQPTDRAARRAAAGAAHGRRGRRRPEGRVPRQHRHRREPARASTPRSTTRSSATTTSSSASRATSRSASAGAPSPTSSRRSAASTRATRPAPT